VEHAAEVGSRCPWPQRPPPAFSSRLPPPGPQPALSEASVGVSSLRKSSFHASLSHHQTRKPPQLSRFHLETRITGQKSGNPGSPAPKPEQDTCPHANISLLYIQCIWSYIHLYTSLYIYIISVSFSLGQPSICTMSYFPSLHLRLIRWSKGDSGFIDFTGSLSSTLCHRHTLSTLPHRLFCPSGISPLTSVPSALLTVQVCRAHFSPDLADFQACPTARRRISAPRKRP